MADRNLQIVSWNVLDSINDPEVHKAIIDTGLDIGVFPEAAKEDEGVNGYTSRAFANAGYNVYSQSYLDDDGRKDRHALAVVAKPELVHFVKSLQLAGRTAIRVTMPEGTEFIGTHLDDRTETRRLRQAQTIARSAGVTAIIAGDLNATYRNGFQPTLVRMTRPLAHALPARDPGQKMSKLERIGSLSQRLTDMVSGTTMGHFSEMGFTDADPSHAATMRLGPVAVQLDHILYRGDISVVQSTIVEDAAGLSDHSRIRATLRV
jgi:endonuclease/exonuclease/phosphatase (EEP) superfamily protein YafD